MNEHNNSSEESLHNTTSEPQSDEDVFDNDQLDDTPSSEVDFEIEFEDDLGPSLKEMLEEASREVKVEQKQEENPNNDSVVEEVSDSEQPNVDTVGKRWYVVH